MTADVSHVGIETIGQPARAWGWTVEHVFNAEQRGSARARVDAMTDIGHESARDNGQPARAWGGLHFHDFVKMR